MTHMMASRTMTQKAIIPPRVMVISGSPSARSKTAMVGAHLARELAAQGLAVDELRVRDLPAEALLSGDMGDAAIAAALEMVEAADGVVLCTPTYKAAYSGLLKSFLDLLPQFGLAGKAVLPIATGGSLAHVLALDYALRPVVQSMGARHVVQGHFLIDTDLGVDDDGVLTIAPRGLAPLEVATRAFVDTLGLVRAETLAAV